jgi:hypothetical protein
MVLCRRIGFANHDVASTFFQFAGIARPMHHWHSGVIQTSHRFAGENIHFVRKVWQNSTGNESREHFLVILSVSNLIAG